MVIGFGGYASGGVMLAARSLGLKTAIHEANVVPGLTNKWLGRIVDRVYLGFEKSGWAFPKPKTLVTGNPVRPEIVNVGLQRQSRPRTPIRILVTGGSQGSDFLNRRVPELLGSLTARGFSMVVRHQAGRFDSKSIDAAYRKAELTASIVPYIDDMDEAYRWADFAVACSGSLTVAELAASRLPALLVPLAGSAADHQAANAMAFAETGLGIWIREAEWNVDVLSEGIARLLSDTDSGRSASPSANRLAIPDAASRIVADCEALMSGDC
jgi:UDP-N-acetylglucosamine--N-acetylmuramyl-(pentapeptide) pyrophosphoryl-undecaprenol N-acetylglucosamine transferase